MEKSPDPVFIAQKSQVDPSRRESVISKKPSREYNASKEITTPMSQKSVNIRETRRRTEVKLLDTVKNSKTLG